jgi:hypothetical protein
MHALRQPESTSGSGHAHISSPNPLSGEDSRLRERSRPGDDVPLALRLGVRKAGGGLLVATIRRAVYALCSF